MEQSFLSFNKNMRYYIDQLFVLISEQTRGITLSDILIVILVAALLTLLTFAVQLKRGKEISKEQIQLSFLIFAYAGILLLITVFRRPAGSRAQLVRADINLGSYKGKFISLKQFIYSILNVLLFVPWGFFIRLKRREEGFIKAVVMTGLTGFLTSFAIETIQYDTGRGYFELTDLVTNVSGTLLGAILASIVILIYRIFKQEREYEQEET